MKGISGRPAAWTAVLLLAFRQASAQNARTDEQVIRSVADGILSGVTRMIVNEKTQETFACTDSLPVSGDYIMQSPYTEWVYMNGVVHMGMIRLGRQLNDERYIQYARDNVAFIFKHAPYFKKLFDAGLARNRSLLRMFRMESLDDCGAMGAGIMDVYAYDENDAYLEYVDRAARYISKGQTRLKDGTLCRRTPNPMTVWSDDLFMSVPFLARAGRLKNDRSYFDDAAKQVIQFTKYLFDSNRGLYYHCWFDDLKRNGAAHWGRGNGWVMMATAELLAVLPEDHPKRDALLVLFRDFVLGVSRAQSESGLWRQILDREDSYLETSCSAMFTYGAAAGVNRGWLDPRYASVALAGWEGLKTKIQEDGQVRDICVGTNVSNDLPFYYKRPAALNDIHGLGPVLMAGAEILKLKAGMPARPGRR